MYLDPTRMNSSFEQRIVRWLEANGCRHWIAVEPVIVRGSIVEYTALALKNQRSIDRQIHGDEIVPIGRKRMRIRIPLSKVA